MRITLSNYLAETTASTMIGTEEKWNGEVDPAPKKISSWSRILNYWLWIWMIVISGKLEMCRWQVKMIVQTMNKKNERRQSNRERTGHDAKAKEVDENQTLNKIHSPVKGEGTPILELRIGLSRRIKFSRMKVRRRLRTETETDDEVA